MQTKSSKFFSFFLVFLISSLCVVELAQFVQASTLYEYYNSGDGTNLGIYGTTWRAGTFTVGATEHTITSVKLKMYRTGSPGTITVSIRATDGSGHPTGSDLTSGTTNGDTLPTGSPYEWREISLTEYTLSASTKYAIVARIGGDASNLVYWRSTFGGTYSGGARETSSDSGSTWNTVTSYDMMFEVYGNAAGGGGPETVSVSLNNPANASSISSWTQNFTYTPTLVGTSSFQNATLYLNGTAAESNSTVLVNATVNGISHTFDTNGTYIWGVKVFNSTTGVFPDGNFTLTVGVTAQSLVNVSISDSFVLSGSESSRKVIGNAFSSSPVVGVSVYSLKLLRSGLTQTWIFSSADGGSKRVYSVTVAGSALSASEGSRKMVNFGFAGAADLAAELSALKYLVSAVTVGTLVNDPFSLSSGLSVTKAVYNSMAAYLSDLFSLGDASDFVKEVGTGLLISTPFDSFVPGASAVFNSVFGTIIEVLTDEEWFIIGGILAAVIVGCLMTALFWAAKNRDE